MFGHTNSNVLSGFIMARSPQWHRGGSLSHLTVARCFSLAVIGGGVRGRWNPPLEVLSWMSPSPPIIEKEVPWVCGRTARNNTPLEAFVFHQTLSTLKASYIERIPSSTSQGRTRIIHILPLGYNNGNEFTILSPFRTTRVLRNTLLQY